MRAQTGLSRAELYEDLAKDGKTRIHARVLRHPPGTAGDVRPVSGMRIDFGPGCRAHYAAREALAAGVRIAARRE